MGQIICSPSIQMAQGQSSSFHQQWITKILLNIQLPKSAKILDVGAGKGELMKRLGTEGFAQLQGIDALPSPGLPGVEWSEINLNDDFSSLGEESFDCILCVEVIEHLENPRNLLRSLRKLLHPQGVLILTTPNVQSWRSIFSFILRGHFVDFLDSSYPAHITPLNEMDLRRILAENEFIKVKHQYSNQGTLPFLTSFKWQTISLNLLQGKRFSDHIMMIAVKEK